MCQAFTHILSSVEFRKYICDSGSIILLASLKDRITDLTVFQQIYDQLLVMAQSPSCREDSALQLHGCNRPAGFLDLLMTVKSSFSATTQQSRPRSSAIPSPGPESDAGLSGKLLSLWQLLCGRFLRTTLMVSTGSEIFFGARHAGLSMEMYGFCLWSDVCCEGIANKQKLSGLTGLTSHSLRNSKKTHSSNVSIGDKIHQHLTSA
ncbi:hypothetical protein MHYP_G00191160 [Metynnis hypsauchen]